MVSETITKEELIFLQKVIKRKPVIWDNLHANDYDHQRVFLGPYSGRDPDIIPHLKGVMTNPNCEYSLNIPPLFTLGAWARCYDPTTGEVSSWNPVTEALRSIPHFLDEAKRPTTIGVHTHNVKEKLVQELKAAQPDTSNVELTKADLELLIHLFWLPHSHGPKGEMLVNEFKYLRDLSHVMIQLDPEDDPDEMDGSEIDFVDSWLSRASSFNNVCRRFAKVCDKFTYIENRELFFDINSYLNNVQVILSACNRYLKWVGLERCRKPIQGGPTLSGLPGGLAGDLQRLYVVKSNFEYPIRSARPLIEKNAYLIKTFYRDNYKSLQESYFKLYCESVNVEMDVVPKKLSDFITKTRLDVFLDLPDVKVLAIECDDVPAATLFGTNNVKQVVNVLKTTYSSSKCREDPNLPVELFCDNQGKLDVPWDLVEKCDAIYSWTGIPDLLYTKQSQTLFELMHMLLGIHSEKKACILLERSLAITKKFLLTQAFKDAYQGPKATVLVFSDPGKVEDMDEQ